jgi:hypothetical protein
VIFTVCVASYATAAERAAVNADIFDVVAAIVRHANGATPNGKGAATGQSAVVATRGLVVVAPVETEAEIAAVVREAEVTALANLERGAYVPEPHPAPRFCLPWGDMAPVTATGLQGTTAATTLAADLSLVSQVDGSEDASSFPKLGRVASLPFSVVPALHPMVRAHLASAVTSALEYVAEAACTAILHVC